MNPVIAFDVYGTLIDPAGIADALGPHAGDLAGEFAQLWREKQLEYTFRRAAMQYYADFAVCTRQALQYTAQRLGVALTESDCDQLMDQYRRLPAFPDAAAALPALRQRDCRLFGFSNGRADDVRGLLDQAGLSASLEDVVSVDEVRSYKPNPAVYAHFLRRADALGEQAWLISGNPFDVIGAISSGMRAVWVRRSSAAVFDPWGIKPTAVVGSLEELPEVIG